MRRIRVEMLFARFQGFSMGPAVIPPNNLTLHVPGMYFELFAGDI